MNPLDYDIYHLGVSGGKDSIAALLWLRYLSGWPVNRIRLSFNETDNEDPLTYAYLAMIADLTGLDVEYVIPACGSFWELAQNKKRFPSTKARFCTQHLKIIPSMRHIEQLKKNGRILILSGITRREGKASNDRGNLEQFSHDDTYGCDKFLPIYEWSLDDIWQIHKEFIPLDYVHAIVEDDDYLPRSPSKKDGYSTLANELKSVIETNGNIPCNPLYHMGARRVGCFPCINSAKLEMRAMAYWRPERVDFIREKENAMVEYSSFFRRNHVPVYWRSKEIVTRGTGEKMNVPTIDDVIAWSHTGSHRPKQFQMGFAAFEENTLVCDLQGMCE